MDRNTEAHFSELPSVEIQRSKFERNSTHKTTFNTGDLIPIFVDEILPGDTVTMDLGSVLRMSTPIYPVMDNAYLDYYFFFVPNRLVWNHWAEFWGENNQTAWEQEIEYEVPQIKAPTGGWTKGTIADYMGIPTNVSNISVNALPFRAYAKIVNDWFRDQNLKNPCMINLDETTVTGSNSGDYVTNTQLGALPFKAAKYHDYFTSCLPEAQKGPAVPLPIGQRAPLIFGESKNSGVPTDNNLIGWEYAVARGNAQGTQDTYYGWKDGAVRSPGVTTSNSLYVDLSNAVGANINTLRQAFAIQRFYEAQARGGTRYIEFLKNIFGVTSPDARLQRSEYLGGKRIPVNMTQVLQTSSTDTTSPQGNTSGFSCTNVAESVFTKSFVEHGLLLGLAVVRTDHTYQQGIERFWSRKKFTDFYLPQFANLGEMPVMVKEIYATGTVSDDEAFGYQEAWADYRYKPNRVSGAFRSNYAQSLDSWHYADDYSSQPILSSEWINETQTNVDRTIAVTSEVENQFLADFYFKADYVRPMPIYSVPGLLDHH